MDVVCQTIQWNSSRRFMRVAVGGLVMAGKTTQMKRHSYMQQGGRRDARATRHSLRRRREIDGREVGHVTIELEGDDRGEGKLVRSRQGKFQGAAIGGGGDFGG